jgi:hypothetical protein
MLYNLIKEDLVLQYLFNKTIFTDSQLDTIIISSILDKDINLSKKVTLRDNKIVTKGSFIRTLRQAQTNLKKSLYTIIIAEYLSLLNKNSFSNLYRISEILNEIKEYDIDKKTINEILNQINITVDKIFKN